jgi:hypothetical protein
VLQKLLPEATWEEYRQDLLRLRKHRLPPELTKTASSATGGTRESEETHRMRAAVEHVASVSHRPYADLAEFWNERLKVRRYSGSTIRDRLRKGDSQSGTHALDYWQGIYSGDLPIAFPGRYPLHPKLEERTVHGKSPPPR